MGDELDAIKHKVIHHTQAQRRRYKRCLRIGAVLFVLFLIYMLWPKQTKCVISDTDYVGIERYERLEWSYKQLSSRLPEKLQALERAQTELEQSQRVRAQLEERVSQLQNEAQQQNKMRQIERQRRKDYESRLEVSSQKRQDLEAKLQQLGVEYNQVMAEKKSIEKELRQLKDERRQDSNGNREKLGENRQRTASDSQERQNQKGNRSTKKPCSGTNTILSCFKNCLGQGLKGLSKCYDDCRENASWKDCFGDGWFGSHDQHNDL